MIEERGYPLPIIESPAEEPVEPYSSFLDYVTRSLDPRAGNIQLDTYEELFSPNDHFFSEQYGYDYTPRISTTDHQEYGLYRISALAVSTGLTDRIREIFPLSEFRLPSTAAVAATLEAQQTEIYSRFEAEWPTDIPTEYKQIPEAVILRKLAINTEPSSTALAKLRSLLPRRLNRPSETQVEAKILPLDTFIPLQETDFVPQFTFKLETSNGLLVVKPIINIVGLSLSSDYYPNLGTDDPRQAVLEELFPRNSIPGPYIFRENEVVSISEGPWKTPETVYCLAEEEEGLVGDYVRQKKEYYQLWEARLKS